LAEISVCGVIRTGTHGSSWSARSIQLVLANGSVAKFGPGQEEMKALVLDWVCLIPFLPIQFALFFVSLPSALPLSLKFPSLFLRKISKAGKAQSREGMHQNQ
jgi:hypothetical protein